MQLYFYKQGANEYGPHDAASLRKLARSGSLRPEDLIRKEGSSQWRVAKEAKGLFGNAAGDATPASNAGNLSGVKATTASNEHNDFGTTLAASAFIGVALALCLHALQWLCGWGWGSLWAVLSSCVLLSLGITPWVQNSEGEKHSAAVFGGTLGGVLGLACGMVFGGLLLAPVIFASVGTWAAWLTQCKGISSRYAQVGAITVSLAAFGYLGMLTPAAPRASLMERTPATARDHGDADAPPDSSVARLMVANTKTADAVRSSLTAQGLRAYDAAFSPYGRFLCLLCKSDQEEFDAHNYSRRTDLMLWDLEKAVAVSPDAKKEMRLTLPAAVGPGDQELACLNSNSLLLWTLAGNTAEHVQTVALPETPANRGGTEPHWRNWNAVTWRDPDTIHLMWQPAGISAMKATRRLATCIVRRKQGGWEVDREVYRDSIISPNGQHIVRDEDLASYNSPYVLRVRNVSQTEGDRTIELPQEARAMWTEEMLGMWDRSSLGGDQGVGPLSNAERGIAFTADSNRLVVLKESAETQGRKSILDIRDAETCDTLYSLPIELSPRKGNDIYDVSRFLGTSADGRILLGVRTQGIESSGRVDARNTLVQINLAEGQVVQRPINGLTNAFLAHGNDFDGTIANVALNKDGSSVWIAITPKPTEVSDIANATQCTTVVEVSSGGQVEQGITLAPFVSGKKLLVSADGEWIAGLGGKESLPFVFRQEDIVVVSKAIEEAEACFERSEYSEALRLFEEALGNEGFSALEARREKYISLCCECLAASKQDQAARQLLAMLDATQYQWQPRLEVTRELVSAVRSEQQAMADAVAREQAEREEERVERVRSENRAKRISPEAMTCSTLIAYLEQCKTAGSLTLRGASAIFSDYALTDICGEPHVDEEWIESRRLWRYGCKDGVVSLTIMHGEPGTVVVFGVDVTRW